jgi:hypothetical protein
MMVAVKWLSGSEDAVAQVQQLAHLRRNDLHRRQPVLRLQPLAQGYDCWIAAHRGERRKVQRGPQCRVADPRDSRRPIDR